MSIKYQLLADQLREELLRNNGQAGWKLPTELELSHQYHMSRQTVRHALRLLEEEGLIQRRQGSGSYSTGRLPGEVPHQIAVVTSFMDDYIFPTILHDASDAFARQGYSTAVYATENQVSTEREILLRLLGEPVSGRVQNRLAHTERRPLPAAAPSWDAYDLPPWRLQGARRSSLCGGRQLWRRLSIGPIPHSPRPPGDCRHLQKR